MSFCGKIITSLPCFFLPKFVAHNQNYKKIGEIPLSDKRYHTLIETEFLLQRLLIFDKALYTAMHNKLTYVTKMKQHLIAISIVGVGIYLND